MATIWDEAKSCMKGQLPDTSFSMWISPITLVENKKDTIVLGCPNKFSLKWVKENYSEMIKESLKKITQEDYDLSLKVKLPRKKEAIPEILSNQRQLPLPSIRRDSNSGRIWLNPEFTFDRFVVGNCNEFAYSASKTLASHTNWTYPHLYMLSNTGLGKSHLSHAIGNAILDQDQGVRVCYVTAEEFMNQMVFAIKNNQIQDFKNKYRRCCDVLLLEDVHFLSGKEKTQVELGHTLDALANDQRRIIFTSSLLPKDIPNLSRELASRLTAGIITTLDRPDLETRIQIIKKKSDEKRLPLSEEVIQSLAKHLTRDIRQIESALSGLRAKADLLKARIDVDLAREEIKSHVSDQGTISLNSIEKLICKYFKVNPLLLRSKSRKKVHAYPRSIYVYLCRNLTEATVEDIGRSINRKHSTVLYSAEVIERKMRIDGKVRNQVNFLKEKLEQKTK